MTLRSSKKRPLGQYLDEEGEAKIYKFKIFMPNGMSVELALQGEAALVRDFIAVVRKEYEKKTKKHSEQKRTIQWGGDMYLEDILGNRVEGRISFKNYSVKKINMLILHDGHAGTVDTYQNMWDITPDTELLSELPAEYSFETALADLIDNSLQAVWSNGPCERRLISVTCIERKITIFDSGQGMDGSEESSIVKWGKMGSSNHRYYRVSAIGGDPPYLLPCFGMYGYGGAVASMHLGRSALVSSKTKRSKKVLTLVLARDELLSNSSSEKIWRTDGGIRDPLVEEMQNSPHGSFTKVVIHEARTEGLDEYQLIYRLKDIYFPYIQYDEMGGKTTMPIEFQVNGVDLAEIDGGEVAVTNLHSCNGGEFVLQLLFKVNHGMEPSQSLGSKDGGADRVANARLKCVYFPIVEGKESIDKILEKLKSEGCSISEDFDSFCRVSIRRLGRLLPDARWGRLPFMEPKHWKGDRVQMLKRCYLRVKCFVETDAGFSPTPYKTDLAHQDPFTTTLRNFGSKQPAKGSATVAKILRDGKNLTLSQLEKEYREWVCQMHEAFDEEINTGEDEPVVLISPCNKKELGFTSESDVIRVHCIIKRRGRTWECGEKVKILKGAVGCPKNDLYATLEFILLEGFQGDVGGEARLICRPLDCPDENGALLTKSGNPSLDIRGSISFPINVIDSGKCQSVDTASWERKLEMKRQKAPALIDPLNAEQCSQLGIDGALPSMAQVPAGYMPPKEIVAVFRPHTFLDSRLSSSLDQKFIVKDDLEMKLEIRFSSEGGNHPDIDIIYSASSKSSSRRGFKGLYIFPLNCCPNLFHKAGAYTFSFSAICGTCTCKRRERRIEVGPADKIGYWRLLEDVIINSEKFPLKIRVGSSIHNLSIACYDVYGNRMPLTSLPEMEMKFQKCEAVLLHTNKTLISIVDDKMSLEIKDLLVESSKLDVIRPHYKDTLEIRSQDGFCSIEVHCQVFPGLPCQVKMRISGRLKHQLQPGDVIQELVLEVLDAYGNHVETGQEISLDLNGFSLPDQTGQKCKVNDQGCVILSGMLKVTSYGKNARLSVYYDENVLFEEYFEVLSGEFQAISKDQLMLAPKTELILAEPTDFGVQSQGTREIMFSPQRSPSVAPDHLLPFMDSIVRDQEKLEKDLENIGVQVKNHETILEKLKHQQSEIDNSICAMKDEIPPEVYQHIDDLGYAKETISKQIERKSKIAASVLSKRVLPRRVREPQFSFVQDVIGIVALLGSVSSSRLSRVLANYLGENHMLAIVCKSSEGARTLERFAQDGKMDCNRALHGATFSPSKEHITSQFHVICLEELSHFQGEVETSQPQSRLNLSHPMLPSARKPSGFQGFAVNMINLDVQNLHTVTDDGRGLRETLFYYLFGELQVYRTRADMEMASECADMGAVSLDGGILRRRGHIVLGTAEPYITFPVASSPKEQWDMERILHSLKEIEEKNTQKAELAARRDDEHARYMKTLSKFKKKKEQWEKFHKEKVPLLTSWQKNL
ncbi:hypothetical protein AMTRI_Chr01g133770 [Amborella trichopoda]